MYNYLIIILIFFTPNKIYTQTDFKNNDLWSQGVHILNTSSNGKWIIYSEEFTNKTNHIHLFSIENKSFRKLEGIHYTFSFTNNNEWLCFLDSERNLNILNLESMILKSIPEALSFHLSQNSKYILFPSGSNKKKTIWNILNLETDNYHTIKNVGYSSINPNKNTFVVSVEKENHSELVKIKLDDDVIKESKFKKLNDSIVEDIFWNNSGQYLASLVQKEDEYTIIGNDFKLDLNNVEANFDRTQYSKITIDISNDGENVFLNLFKKKEDPYNNQVQIWGTKDSLFYLKKREYLNSEMNKKTFIWNVEKDKLFNVEEIGLKSSITNARFSNALLYNRSQYGPSYNQKEFVDIYIKNLTTNHKKIIASKQYFDHRYVSISPSGRYITYFKEFHWWIYDSLNDLTLKLTNGLQYPLYDKDDWENDNNKKPYGNPGWTLNEECIIIYDQYDIWFISPDGSIKQKITNGRKKNITYRINSESIRKYHSLKKNDSEFIGIEFNNNKPIYLDMEGVDLNTGFSIIDKDKKVKELIYSETKKSQFFVSDDNEIFFFTEEKYNLSPSIVKLHLDSLKQKQVIYQTNPQLNHFDLGKYEIINQLNKNGDSINYALLYPSNFNPNNKYPLITYIYEKSSIELNKFNPPTKYNSIGFSILNYIMNEYFVLLPDIKFDIGNPGKSALSSTLDAISSAVEVDQIDESRIGLLGHSFGGYEAVFISTQTNKFKAIVGGAAATDLFSFYHDIQWSWGDMQASRMENQQFRMGDSYYKIPDNYLKNSPIHHIKDLNTPLLLWTGKNDTNINWYQSNFMYSAMRRLNKEGKLIIFNNEGHTIESPSNQKILSDEIFKWFEKYLKDKKE